MRTLVRLVVALLLTISIMWIAWWTNIVVGAWSDAASRPDWILLPLNVVINAWPAFVLMAVAAVLLVASAALGRKRRVS